MSLLTPEEIEQECGLLERDEIGAIHLRKYAATLRAYAEVVEAVAEKSKPKWVYIGALEWVWRCEWCLSVWGEGEEERHEINCPGLRARELRKR